MTVPDPEMTHYELDTLRVLNGETVAHWVGGAAANVCCSWLKGRGYAEGFYRISQKGRDYLAALSSGEQSPQSEAKPSAGKDTRDELLDPLPPIAGLREDSSSETRLDAQERQSIAPPSGREEP